MNSVLENEQDCPESTVVCINDRIMNRFKKFLKKPIKKDNHFAYAINCKV